MQLIYEYGFSVDADTKRVYLNDGKVSGFNQSIPQGNDGITKGSDKGDVVGKTAKVGYNNQLNLVYNDVKGKPYAGKVITFGDLPHDENNKLLVDTVGEIKEYKHGLAFTVNNAVAMILLKPNLDDPIIGGQYYDDGVYKYCVFYSNATTGYEAVRTKAGINVELEVLLVGAGGAGKGQTVTLAKGGDGGGGQLTIGTLNSAYEGSIFITVPSGGLQTENNPENTTVKEANTVLIAIAGKNATDKNDATGYPCTEVPKSWQELQSFKWFMPESFFVGGVSKTGEQDYPSGMFFGQAGAGTKDSKPGKGKESFVAIRWKK